MLEKKKTLLVVKSSISLSVKLIEEHKNANGLKYNNSP